MIVTGPIRKPDGGDTKEKAGGFAKNDVRSFRLSHKDAHDKYDWRVRKSPLIDHTTNITSSPIVM